MTAIPAETAYLVQALVLLLAVVSLLLTWGATRRGSPVMALFGRWVRWLFLSMLTGGTVYVFGWSGYSLEILLVVAVLGCFLVETLYNWVAISALSRSTLPLFPRFEENERGGEWPSTPAFIHLREWARREGFQRRQALVAHVGEEVLMRMSVFEDAAQTTRLHVMLLPNPKGQAAACLTLYSCTLEGEVIVTDNIFLPFGGFYPDNWRVERRPWMRSAERLFQRHGERLDALDKELMPFTLEPLEQINEDQQLIEQVNRELGFLNKRPDELEAGRLTPSGKARLWQEIWTLSYLGLPLNYD